MTKTQVESQLQVACRFLDGARARIAELEAQPKEWPSAHWVRDNHKAFEGAVPACVAWCVLEGGELEESWIVAEQAFMAACPIS